MLLRVFQGIERLSGKARLIFIRCILTIGILNEHILYLEIFILTLSGDMRDMLRYYAYTYHRFDCAIHNTRDFIEIIYIFIFIIVYTIITLIFVYS